MVTLIRASVTAKGRGASSAGLASSYSDAPLIKQDPQANLTDVYAFIGTKFDDPDRTVLNVIANVRPFSEPGDGPRYERFADGHELWIEPWTYHPGVGEAFRLELRHGERFRGERVPRLEDLIDRFTLARAKGEAPVVGRSGGPASLTRAANPGLHIAGYRSRRMRNDLDAASSERQAAASRKLRLPSGS